MANLENNIPIAHIHLNISGTFDFIDANLPAKYSSQTLALLAKDKKVDPSYIRVVKKYRIKNEPIINALYLVAQRNLAQKESQKKQS